MTVLVLAFAAAAMAGCIVLEIENDRRIKSIVRRVHYQEETND